MVVEIESSGVLDGTTGTAAAFSEVGRGGDAVVVSDAFI